MADELVNPKITASILVRMEDVTDKINAGLNAGMSESERTKKVNEICRKLETEVHVLSRLPMFRILIT